MEIYISTGVTSLNIHCRYSLQTPQLVAFLTALSMANSASNTASARVSPMPVRVLVASRNTAHFQPYGFVVSTTSNWIVLYSMTTLRDEFLTAPTWPGSLTSR